MPRGASALVVLALVAGAARAAGAGSDAKRPAGTGEAIVVIGAGVREAGTLGPRGTARLESALELARARPAATVIVSGGAVTSERVEAEVMADWLAARGVDRSRLRIEPVARHTGENADFAVQLLPAGTIRSITVVTDRIHVPRARYHFKTALREQGRRGVRVHMAGVPDGVRGFARLKEGVVERFKVLRDVRLRDVRRRTLDRLVASGSKIMLAPRAARRMARRPRGR